MNTRAIIHRAVSIIHHELPGAHWQVFLFGSQANATAHATSDIDIGILGLTTVSLEKMAAIREAMDRIPTLRSIDVVDLRSVSQRFQKQALERAKVLN